MVTATTFDRSVADRLLTAAREHASPTYSWIDRRASSAWTPGLTFYPDIPMPPENLVKHIQSNVQPDFRVQAFDWLATLEAHDLLWPGMTVLDVGCGFGQMAYALRAYLSERGRYVGHEVFGQDIEFLRGAFAVDPRFSWVHSDLYNQQYNPMGQALPESWPVADASVDLALALSVFSHTDLAVTRFTLGEITRILRPGAALFATVIVAPSPDKCSESAFSTQRTREDWTALFGEYDLTIAESWAGERQASHPDDQWTLVLRKPAPPPAQTMPPPALQVGGLTVGERFEALNAWALGRQLHAPVSSHHERAVSELWPWLAPLGLGSALEVAAGEPPYLTTRMLREHGLECVALDYLDGEVRADLQSLPFEAHSFDLVVARHALEHVLCPYLALSEMIRVSRGWLLVVTPVLSEKANHWPDHLWALGREGWERIYHNLGLEVMEFAEGDHTEEYALDQELWKDGEWRWLLRRRSERG